MSKMRDLTRQLEVSLGPETSELAMRFGLHSGPVTAGVLRGEKSRFQLFGDTVNTGKVYCASEFCFTKILVSFFASQFVFFFKTNN